MSVTHYTTVSAVKPMLNVPDTWVQDDTLINTLIIQASALIKAFIRYDPCEMVHVEYYDTAPRSNEVSPTVRVLRFNLANTPVNYTVAPVVKYNSAGDFVNAVPLIVDQDYYIDQNTNEIILYPDHVDSVQRSVQITYTAGIAITAEVAGPPLIPAHLNDVEGIISSACQLQVAAAYKRIKNSSVGNQGSSSDKRGSQNDSAKPSGLFTEAQALLKGKVRIMVGRN